MVAGHSRCDPADAGGGGSWDCCYTYQTCTGGDNDKPYTPLSEFRATMRSGPGEDAVMLSRGLNPDLVRRVRTRVAAKQYTDWVPDPADITGPWLSNREVR